MVGSHADAYNEEVVSNLLFLVLPLSDVASGYRTIRLVPGPTQKGPVNVLTLTMTCHAKPSLVSSGGVSVGSPLALRD